MKTVYFFATGQTACFIAGAQVPDLQESWLILWAEHAEKLGYDPTQFDIELNGRKAKIFKTELGYNWQLL